MGGPEPLDYPRLAAFETYSRPVERASDDEIDVEVDDAKRQALVEGIWNTTALMKANEQAIAETADSLPYLQSAD